MCLKNVKSNKHSHKDHDMNRSVEYVDTEVVTVDKLSEYNNLCLCKKGIWI